MSFPHALGYPVGRNENPTSEHPSATRAKIRAIYKYNVDNTSMDINGIKNSNLRSSNE
jgi:hypothetical protein